MQLPVTARSPSSWFALKRSDLTCLTAAFGLALVAGWLTTMHPTLLPSWAPWEFSWTQFLATALAVIWYARGVILMSAVERPVLWRQVSFLLGVGSIYAVLLTHFEYMAQHMFFLNRLQHAVMHHFGPFLVALSWPGAALSRGMPTMFRPIFSNRVVSRAMRGVQQPVLAGILFVGLIGLWLIPVVHFQAMIDPRLYTVMNWSMVLDGLLFWFLVLDPRPAPPAQASFATRLAVTLLVMFPQIAMGAQLTFSTRSLYSYYDLCGRLFPSIGPLQDQHIGGIIVWIPSAMMSSLAFLLILNHLRLYEDQLPVTEPEYEDGGITIDASRWTGR